MMAVGRATYLAQKVTEAGMSVSLNSNLYTLTADRALRLHEAGIDHILTTIHAATADGHDAVTQVPGSFERTMQNIELAQSYGIRITVNTILSEHNKGEIYEIGRILQERDVRKFLVNRTIPSPANTTSTKKQYIVDKKTMLRAYDELLMAKEDFHLEIGTCRTVPMCLFDDLEKYRDFAPRGCAAGKKHMILDVGGNLRVG
jgi:MoaA/NifB/PqqE/SkfB family radical SAM enzyme